VNAIGRGARALSGEKVFGPIEEVVELMQLGFDLGAAGGGDLEKARHTRDSVLRRGETGTGGGEVATLTRRIRISRRRYARFFPELRHSARVSSTGSSGKDFGRGCGIAGRIALEGLE
jgi:hypothetical protein